LITPDSEFFRFTFHILPWITYVVLVLGILFQVKKWLGGAPPEQVKESEGVLVRKSEGKIKKTIREFVLNLVVQRRMLRKNPNSIALWVISWIIFHIALFLIVIGHLRGFHVWYADWFTWAVSKEFLVKTLPFYVGFVVLAGAALLLLRRIVFTAPRAISTSSNYIALLLIIITIVAGITMRILPHTTGAFFVTVPPGFTMYLEDTPSLVWLTIHVFLAQIVVMYLPFSMLIHILGSIVTTIASSLSSARGEHDASRKTKGNVEVA
jgi:nitrate reductase gamma subunit